ncbi:peptidoglycan DD-metalloendopeptidase family protein [Asticcacaulis sp.]|uniref:peptidoglycan DD-metalloendopeptidase family protein n=1 Tax=Asticcacaulis sp. TaxID=1872648 RepID=UPI002CDC715B|nr:peptidoglycan DD-metalloendopeptidase family protein [Asticcacaulis sp.]HTM81489.1 peptidoglycan DD-metalloendopeptidase family protein [Asticcacaulis sp.]
MTYDLYSDWLKTAPPRAEIMAGLHTHFEPIRLDAEGAQALGLKNGLPGDAVLAKGLLVGGYDEERAIYSGPVFAAPDGAEPRTVHLGIDLFEAAGAPVFAPLAGVVHSFQDNANPKDYGPTIILAHAVTSQLTFYTLYGHLSRDSLYGLAIGKPVAAGEEVARLGAAAVNGDWPPHLHFQLILDMQDKRGDYPGVFKKSEREQWKRICPDPAPLLGI